MSKCPRQEDDLLAQELRLQDSWQVAAEVAGLMVWAWDVAADRWTLSPALAAFLGPRQTGEAGEVPWLSRIPQREDRARVRAALQGLAQGRDQSLEWRHALLNAAGDPQWMHARASVTAVDERGHALQIVGSLRDVTREQDAQDALRDSEQRFRLTLENSPIGLTLVALDGSFMMVNRALCTMLGYRREELLCKTFQDITHPDDLDEDLSLLAELLEGKRERYRMDKRYFCKDGRLIWVQLDVSLLRSADGQAMHFISQIQNITRQREMAERLVAQARTDSLTGLPNRMAMEETLEAWLQRAEPGAVDAWLVYLDVDHFKLINDRAGHAAGDALLQQLAAEMGAQIGPGDFLARVGGDEFVVLLAGRDESEVQAWTDELLGSLDRTPFCFEGDSYRCTVSMGAVPLFPLAHPADILIQADTAAYAAKADGRGRCHFFADNDETIQQLVAINSWAEQIQRAFDEQRFCLFLEKIVDPAGVTLGYEALLRLRDHGQRVIGPDAFLPTVQQLDWTARLDRWVLIAAAELLAPGGSGLPEDQFLSVNISARSLSDGSFTRWLQEWITRQPFDPDRLHLEITETQRLSFSASEMATLALIRSTGVQVWLDDFGTGFNSFELLKRMQVDGLKIDRSFTHDLANDPIDSALIQTIAKVCSKLGLSVVAEGVDQPDTVRMLNDFGIRQQQGWHFHQAEDAAQVLRRLKDRV